MMPIYLTILGCLIVIGLGLLRFSYHQKKEIAEGGKVDPKKKKKKDQCTHPTAHLKMLNASLNCETMVIVCSNPECGKYLSEPETDCA